jgi:acyl carrier protein
MQTSEIQSKIKEIIAGMFDLQPEDVSDLKSFTEMAKYDSMRAL